MLVILIYKILDWIIYVYSILILLRALLSWFPIPSRFSWIYDLLFILTEPLLKPVRTMLWRSRQLRVMPVDISPVALLMLLYVFKAVLNIVYTVFAHR